MFESSIIWLNGRLIPAKEASLSPFDHGLLVGDGIFETLIAYGGKPFAASRHAARLHRSGQMLGIDAPGHDLLLQAYYDVLKANQLDHPSITARLRVTVTSGPGPLGSDKGGGDPLIMIATTEAPRFQGPANVVVVPFTRNPKSALAGAKTTSYGENVVALAYAKSRGGSEALFTDTAGHISEGTGSNVFFAKDGMLHTPSLATGCLAGVTRALVIELLFKEGIPFQESIDPLSGFLQADEAFLTSTTREVQGIGLIDGNPLPSDNGPITRRVHELYQRLKNATIDP
jgi:branched-chain amino acid aminotransferase